MQKTHDFSNLILRWSLGRQDTTRLSEFDEDEKFSDFAWLAKLSILSFQKFFPGAKFVLLYNGQEFGKFINWFDQIDPVLISPIEYIDQIEMMETMDNPYSFAPRGVWWKWLPFRLDINKHEIAVDTDIICINPPKSWYAWLTGSEEIIITPERFEKVLVNTCGDFYNHPILRGKKPFNCGVVGQRSGFDYGARFFEIASEVEFGKTHNSLFITEQGAINLWIRSLELDGVTHHVLNFEKNAWVRDFLFFIHRGVVVETVHAVTWYKTLIKALAPAFVRKIMDPDYDNTEFLSDLLKQATKRGIMQDSRYDGLARFTLERQIGSDGLKKEFFPTL